MELALKLEPKPRILRRITDEAGWRWYTESDDLAAPKYAGVTNVLSCAVAQKLQDYMKNNSANKQAKRLIETGDIGTAIHAAIEADLNGLKPELTEQTAQPFQRWLELKEKHQIKAYQTETMVCSDRFGWAGTFDIYGEFDGKPAIMDIKTGFVGVKAGWQMASYRSAAIEMGLTDKSCGLVALSIHRDGTIGTPFVYEHLDWCLKSWVSCFEVWKALYFSKLNKQNWKWLHVNSLEVLNG